jgi:lysozyme
MNFEKAMDMIKADEGFKRYPYRCTAGKLTIGYGRNIEDVGISESEAGYLLYNDVYNAWADLAQFLFPAQFSTWPERIQTALVNMRFQLGHSGFRSFEKMIKALRVEDFSAAAHEILDSKYAKEDTPERAERIASMVRDSAETVHKKYARIGKL